MRKKPILRCAFLISLLAALCCGSALAASSEITVQLDGKAVAFTDAAPVAKDGRTYVPFRALFQAMGATVSYDSGSQTVSAARDGKTVSFVLGSKEIQVREDDKTQIITADAAAYAENGRTLVPVRFAAQCFGMNVGWDPWYRTVVITDVEKLMVTVSGQFTKMDGYLAYARAFQQKIYQVDGTLNTQLQVQDEAGNPIPLETVSQVTGLVDHQNSDLTLRSTTDLSPLLADLTEEQKNQNQSLLDLMAQHQAEILTDQAKGTAYIQSRFYNTLGGVSADGWYQTGWDSLLATYSTDPAAIDLIRMEGDSFEEVLAAYLRNIEVTSRDDTRVSKIFQLFRSAFGDKYFTHQAAGWTAKGAVTTDSGEIYTMQTTLKTTGDTVQGYAFTVTSREGSNTETITLDMTVSRNLTMACQRVTGNVTSNTHASLYFGETAQKPQTQPPAGSIVTGIERLSSLLGL